MIDNDRAGILWALAGFIGLSCGDAIIKTMAGAWPPTAVAALRYTIGAVGLGVWVYAHEGFAGLRFPRPGVQLMRGFGVALATLCFFSAVFVMPLAVATAIVFVSPMITAILAIFILGEHSRRETWMATVAGFLGVLIVLRPDPANFDWNALLPLGAAVGMSLLVIGNRMAARLASAASMQFTLAVIAAAMLLAAAFIGDAWGRAGGAGGLTIAMPTWDVVARCAFVAVTATLSHLMVYLGTTRAGAATIAPMTYVQIIVASALGVVLFGNVPDLWTLAGAAIIIAAGLYLWRSNSAYARAVAI